MTVKTDGKEPGVTTDTSSANTTSKNQVSQTTDAIVGGAGMGTANPDDKKEDAKDEEKGDPVAVVKGTVVEDVVDVALPGLVPFVWRRRYSSADYSKTTPLGRGGWTHEYHRWIEPDGDGWVLRNFDGVDLSFGPIPNDGGALHRGRQLLLRRGKDQFDVLHLGSRLTEVYASTYSGGRAFLRSIADGYGNRLLFHYLGELLSRITDTAGREVHLQHDEKGRIIAIDVEVDKKSQRHFTYGYSDAGELAFAADASGKAVRYVYDGMHRIVRKTLRNGFTIHYEYDPFHGRVIRTSGDGGFHQVEFTYDFDKRTTTTHGEPQPRIYHWDAAGNILKEETLDGRYVIEKKWDANHLLLSEKNAAGEEHRYERDDRGFLTKYVDPAGNETLYEYVDDLLRRVVRPNGNVRSYDYDGYGSLWGLTLETGARYSVDRDGRGRIVAVYGPTGLIEKYEYSERHDLIKATSARGAVTIYEYDHLGRPTLRRDPLGRATQLEYDLLNRIKAITHPDGTRIGYTYDGAGKVTRIEKPGGDILMEHIATGSLSRAIMEDGGEWRISYDREEKPVRIENPKNERYEFRYDRAGRVVEERTFDGRTIKYGYDLSGRLHRIDNPDATWREFAYDALGNLIEETSPHGPVTFKRDAQGRLLEATLEEGPVLSNVSFERDEFGRVVAETQDGQTIRYEYDAEGRIGTRILPGGQTTRYFYDLDGECDRVEHDGQTVHITRDFAGQERLRYFAGSPTAIASNYDVMGRLVTQEAVAPRPEGAAAIAALVRRKWEYDAMGRPQRIEDARWGTTDYFYDKTHNLVRAQRGRIDEAFEYDPAGGLIRAFQGLATAGERWSVAQGDVLVRTKDAAYEYDACRRRTKKVELADGKATDRVTEYIWDCRDRLREVRLPNGDIVRYFYDAFGRRTRKVVFPAPPKDSNETHEPSRLTRFFWDGDVLAAEIDTVRGARGFVHEPGTFRPLLQFEQGEVFLYVLDQVGTPRELIDARGRVAWAAAYKAWGQIADVQRDPQIQRARPIESPFRLLGQYADDETGLHWTRFRYWDPEVGRWCSPDPLGIGGGTRLFAFDGSPTWLVDPLGLDTKTSKKAEDPGLRDFVERLKAAGIKVTNTNISIMDEGGQKTLGEIDVVTENALIQYKNGSSSAQKLIDQVVNKTDPFVTRPVVAFVNDTGKAGDRAVKNAGPYILVTNDFNLLVEVIK